MAENVIHVVHNGTLSSFIANIESIAEPKLQEVANQIGSKVREIYDLKGKILQYERKIHSFREWAKAEPHDRNDLNDLFPITNAEAKKIEEELKQLRKVNEWQEKMVGWAVRFYQKVTESRNERVAWDFEEPFQELTKLMEGKK